MEPHLNLVSALDNVPVGYDQPCLVNDDAGAEKINHNRSMQCHATSFIVKGIDDPFSRDPDDGGQDGFNYVGE